MLFNPELENLPIPIKYQSRHGKPTSFLLNGTHNAPFSNIGGSPNKTERKLTNEILKYTRL